MKIEMTENHEYFIDNIPATGVNELLSTHGLGLDIDSMCSAVQANFENARIRGQYLHTMSALHLQGRLNESTLDSQLFPYLVGLKKLLIENKIEPIAIEEKIGFKNLLICGTPDLRCNFNDIHAMLDFKFVQKLRKYYELQLGGYQYIFNANNKEPEKEIKQSVIAHILPNDYKIELCGFDVEDEFRNLLLSYHIKKKYKESL